MRILIVLLLGFAFPVHLLAQAPLKLRSGATGQSVERASAVLAAARGAVPAQHGIQLSSTQRPDDGSERIRLATAGDVA